MEDRYSYFEKNGTIISFVCDGHGGYTTAERTVKELTQILYENLLLYDESDIKSNINQSLVIRNTINNWGIEVKEYNRKNDDHSGTTLTGFVSRDNTVYIFNVGDSRTCVLLKPSSHVYKLPAQYDYNGNFMDKTVVNYTETNFFVTEDHDPLNKTELERIFNANGKIFDERLNGILSLTRAIGDIDIGKGLSFVPDMYWIKKDDILGPVIMFSDGLYEPGRYMTPGKGKKVNVNFSNIHLYYLAKKNAKELVDYAYENGSEDNLTVLVVSVK